MEARDIANITYELIRVRLDRCCMEYEDQLSRLTRDNILLRRKYDHVKKTLIQQKDDYVALVEKVKAFTASKSSSSSSSSSSSGRKTENVPSTATICGGVGTSSSSSTRKDKMKEKDRISPPVDHVIEDPTVQKTIQEVMKQSQTTTTTATNANNRRSSTISSPPPRMSTSHEQQQQQPSKFQQQLKSPVRSQTTTSSSRNKPVVVAVEDMPSSTGGTTSSARKRKRHSSGNEEEVRELIGDRHENDGDTPLKDQRLPHDSIKGSLDEWMEADPSLPLIPPVPIPPLPLVYKSKDDISVFPSRSSNNIGGNGRGDALDYFHDDDRSDRDVQFIDKNPTYTTTVNKKSIITGTSAKSIKRSMTTNQISTSTTTDNNSNNINNNGPGELLFIKKTNNSGNTAATTTATTNSRAITASKKQPSMISWVRETEHLPHYNKVDQQKNNAQQAAADRYEPKFVEVVRNKDRRSILPGHECEECAKFYQAMQQQGIVNDTNRHQFMQSCSRHKSKFTPPSTPDGFWDLSIRTPAEWH